ncbi:MULTISPECIES: sensor histidine kinase [Streptomyces]|uniref:histidine kinase n=1 Tax=Streptomyces caniscabiei TaxID=2746961 RepID=A0ABU4MQ71_9ACTN|nr:MULTISPECIES: histidine kinase [Streptomyces]MBE4733806.1 two-component sensor histidine kinase [Streptomyces caniscabiei]MBE4754983.1 two-component sensor histidine kinase [Streptomyces caniscabiei]MBE4768197.1 two-component sensor histidine kinase [Streptomyces caniscabiei]MBE4782301.1 two-component sensor histidine kinase [Streptomyces caniscabiei]MBE4793589.1 two-component sensor histidine kinase [Streptomyces caniscabiei]
MNLVLDTKEPPAGAPGRPTRPARAGCVRVGGIVALCLACASDFPLLAANGVTYLWLHLLSLAVGLAALLWPVHRRPDWLTPQVRAGVPALAALANVVILVLVREMGGFGLGQAALLLCLLVVAVRACSPGWALACGLLDGLALVLLPLPYLALDPDDGGSIGAVMVLMLLGGVAAGVAAYLRTLDNRRNQIVTETRRAERLAMAADLHDFVAHHVTGILVQTQVARMMAATEPGRGETGVPPDDVRGRLDPVLAGIERAATEALASMRRTVGVLRDHEEGPGTGDRRPVGDLAGVDELVRGFDGVGGVDGRSAVLRHDPSVPADLPHEVQAAAFRVVQEALTNVRRHAADATEVTVDLLHGRAGLEVLVRDDGRGGARLPEAARGGGFGLVGLTERVTALGGSVRARPREDGPGWEVRAVLPTAPRSRPLS